METKQHYFNRNYMRRERYLSYIDQISTIFRFSESNDCFLEVGKGNGFLEHTLKTYYNLSVETLDFNEELEPDYVADICDPLFKMDKIYETGLCFEVFEHIEWKLLPIALENILNHISKYLILSVPDLNFFIQPKLDLFFRKYIPYNRAITIPRFYNSSNVFGADHKWEIGVKHNNGVRLTAAHFINEIIGAESLVTHFRGREMPGHHYFVIKGRATGEK